MKTICISTLKGGDGKSTITVILALFLSSLGYRVLVVDLDGQHSTTSFFLRGKPRSSKHIGKALTGEPIESQIEEAVAPNIDLVPGSFAVYAHRSVGFNQLRRALPPIAAQYDFCIIDTPGSYDNLVINGLNAADLIITPVTLKSAHSLEALMEYRSFIEMDCPLLLDSYAILYNIYSDDKEGAQYEKLWEKNHPNFFESKLKETAQIKAAYDYKTPIKNNKQNSVLYPFLKGLTLEILAYFGLPIPDSINEAMEVEQV